MLGVLAFLIACQAVIQVYALYALLRTSYVLGPNKLTIVCGAVRYVVALGSISNVVGLGSRTHSLKLRAASSPLVGYPIRAGHIEGIGDVLLLSTTGSLARMVVITASEGIFAVSPANRDMFIEELNARRGGLQFQPAPVQKITPGLARLTFWQDRLAQALFLAALVGNLAVFAYVSFRFPGLPPLLPLHYNSLGEIDFIGTRAEAFKIPAIGTAAILADIVVGIGVHAREKLATRLLLGVAIVVQAILFVAVVRLI